MELLIQKQFDIMMRSFDKENQPNTCNSLKTEAKVYRPSLKAQELTQFLSKTQPIQLGSLSNFQTFQKQLKKQAQAFQQQRKQNLSIKSKLQNQIYILKKEKENKEKETSKLHQTLSITVNKYNQLQQKNNTILGQCYRLDNLSATLDRHLANQKIQKQMWKSKCQQMEATLKSDYQKVLLQNGEIKNQATLRQLEIQMLRKTIKQMQIENKRVQERYQQTTKTNKQNLQKMCNELQNWKTAFQLKQSQLEQKTMLLHQENEMMKKTMNQLSESFMSTSSRMNNSFARTYSFPVQPSVSQSTSNQYHVRLFIKEREIEKMGKKIRQLQQKMQELQLQNTILSKKCNSSSIFSVQGYKKYSQLQTKIFQNNTPTSSPHHQSQELQEKNQQLQLLSQKIVELEHQNEELLIEIRKNQSQFVLERIDFQNKISEMESAKTKLQRQVEQIRNKVNCLNKECQEKDRIIVNYVNKQKQKDRERNGDSM